MTYTDSYSNVIEKMTLLRNTLTQHVTYCQGLVLNLEQEMEYKHEEIPPVEATSRLRELIGLK